VAPPERRGDIRRRLRRHLDRRPGGPGWESADDWAALAAAAVILYNGVRLLRAAMHEIMDRTPGPGVLSEVRRAAESVPGVLATEKLAMRKAGTVYRLTIHVQADPLLTLRDAHVVGGRVKSAIREALPRVQSVLVHMEPYEPAPAARVPGAGSVAPGGGGGGEPL
jgi:divalent metal cation (Fe/Co/Zn/Cd) transporter